MLARSYALLKLPKFGCPALHVGSLWRSTSETGLDLPLHRDKHFLTTTGGLNEFGKLSFALPQCLYHVTIVVFCCIPNKRNALAYEMDAQAVLKLANSYKEQIFTKLRTTLPERMANLDRSVFEGKTTEEVLALVYMQGAAEALDAFDMTELLRAVARESGAVAEGLEAVILLV